MLEELNRWPTTPDDTPDSLIPKAALLKHLHRHSNAYRLYKQMFEKGEYHPDGVRDYRIYLMWQGEYDRVADVVATVKRAKGE